MQRGDIYKLLISILVTEGIGLSGSFFTFASLVNWYPTLSKPFFNPPNWIFAPVWTLLYLLMGISLFFVWKKDPKFKKYRIALYAFAMQLGLNFAWTVLFFGLRSTFYGMVGILVLLGAIIFTVIEFYKASRTAFYLLLPYLAWVSFATILNIALWMLNV